MTPPDLWKSHPRSGTRRLAAVAAYFGTRELAWMDDEIHDDAYA